MKTFFADGKIPEAMSLITYLEEEFDEQTGLRINLPENFRLDALLFDENSQLFRPFPGFRAKVQLVCQCVEAFWNLMKLAGQIRLNFFFTV
jgi:hypothetical protein